MSGKKNITILIVDDDEDFRLQQTVQLEAAGYAVVTAPSRAEAEALLETRTPDLAIVDLMMEEMDGGFSLCYHIKKKHPELPVILASGVAHETGLDFDASTAEERGWVKADAFLAKPLRFEQLQREIEHLLGGRA